MTHLGLIEGASLNLVETYVRLAMSVPGTRSIVDDAYIACEGNFPHPMCNFAARLRLDPWSANRLRAFAGGRPYFAAYVLPDDRPGHLNEILVRAGFRRNHQMVQLAVARPRAIQRTRAEVEMYRATGQGERRAITDFMGRQFFGRQSEIFRRQAAAATADAESLDLYAHRQRGRIRAAVMLCDAGGVLGVYNLCVAASSRGRGLGSAVLNWALDLGGNRGQPMTLQCDPALEPWYNYLGLASTGMVDVYSLPKTVGDDIIL